MTAPNWCKKNLKKPQNTKKLPTLYSVSNFISLFLIIKPESCVFFSQPHSLVSLFFNVKSVWVVFLPEKEGSGQGSRQCQGHRLRQRLQARHQPSACPPSQLPLPPLFFKFYNWNPWWGYACHENPLYTSTLVPQCWPYSGVSDWFDFHTVNMHLVCTDHGINTSLFF